MATATSSKRRDAGPLPEGGAGLPSSRSWTVTVVAAVLMSLVLLAGLSAVPIRVIRDEAMLDDHEIRADTFGEKQLLDMDGVIEEDIPFDSPEHLEDSPEDLEDSPRRMLTTTNATWKTTFCSKRKKRIVIKNRQSWCLDARDKVWRYVSTTKASTLVRRTRDGIEQCLANKHVLMIGDSRTRFMYTALASVLTSGRFPNCKKLVRGDPGFDHNCLLARERVAWKPFYEETNRLLNTANSSEVCFCYRSQVPTVMLNDTRENRLLMVSTKWGPIRLSYIQAFTDSCTLETSFPPLSNGALSCEPGQCGYKLNQNITELSLNSTSDCLWTVARRFNDTMGTPVTHAFVTSGWFDKDIGCDVVNFTKATNIPTWVISPAEHTKNYGLPFPTKSTVQSCGPPQFNLRAVTDKVLVRPLYADPVHVGPSINEEFSHMILNKLCKDQARG